MGAYVRSLGRLGVFVIALMGVFAGVAHASSVSGVTVDNTAPSIAAGAKTVYTVSFTTTAGPLSGSDKVMVTYPAGTNLATVVGTVVTDNTTQTNVGSCSRSGLVASCGLFGGQSIGAGDSVTVELDGVTNPSSAATNLQVSVTTTDDVDAANSASYDVDPNNAVSGVSVDNATPSAAQSAETIYKTTFTTSSTGGMSSTAGSQITVTFPTGTNLATVVGTVVTDNTTQTNVGSCSRSGLVATCGFFGGEVVNAGDSVTVELDGVTNPSTPSTTEVATVSTTSDNTTPVNSSNYSVVANHPVTGVSVVDATPSAAQSAKTIYKTTFTTSSTGGMSSTAGSQITVTFPTGTNLATVVGTVVTDNTTQTNVGSCSRSGLVATCGFFGGEVVNAGDSVTVELDGVTNPSTPSTTEVATVSTTSDNTTPVNSSNYSVVANHPVTGVLVVDATPSAAQSAKTIYKTTFTTSSTGGMSSTAGSQITVTFPTGTNLATVVGTVVTDNTTQTNVGSCSRSGLVATCGFFGGEVVNAGDSVTVELDGVTNPSTPSTTEVATVSTTSDNTTPVNSSNYSVVANHPVTAVTFTLSNLAGSATGVTYRVGFTASITGAMSSTAGSQITVTFPAGTSLTPVNNTVVTDNTTHTNVGSCTRSGLVATCGFFGSQVVNAGDSVTVELDNVTNPSSPPSPETATVSTTSDTATVTSGGGTPGGPNPPTVTSINPTSGPAAGNTSVTINGANLTGGTVAFGSNPASVTSNTGTQIVATSPAGTGSVDVTVSTSGGTSTTGPADRFTYQSPVVPPPPSATAPSVAPAAPKPTNPSAATVSSTVNPGGLATTVVFQYGLDPSLRGPGSSTALYDQSTAPQQVGSDSSSHAVSANLTNLVPGALYHVRVVATNSAGTTNGPDQTFTTQKPATPPAPVLGQTQNAQPISGKTFILINGRFVPLTATTKIPSGATIDALRGTLSLTSATGAGKKTQTGTFSGAVFKVTQAHSGLTTLSLVNNAFKGAPSFASCAKHASKASAAALSARTIQLLHGRDSHGKFRSKGRYAAATTRGTVWSLADRCDGTLTQVNAGAVVVSDFVRHRNVTVRAHHSYLAKAHK